MFKNIGVVIRRVSRCGQRNQHVAVAEPDAITFGSGLVLSGQVGRGWGDERRPQPGGQARAASYIVGVGVSVGRPRDAKALLLRDLFVSDGEPGRVDDRGGAVTEVDEVGGIPRPSSTSSRIGNI